jgi:hypothetical protein
MTTDNRVIIAVVEPPQPAAIIHNRPTGTIIVTGHVRLGVPRTTHRRRPRPALGIEFDKAKIAEYFLGAVVVVGFMVAIIRAQIVRG